MKTVQNTTVSNIENTNRNNNEVLKRIFLFSFLYLLIVGNVKGQNQAVHSAKNIGIALYSNININGYGAEYLPGIFYKNKRKLFFVAPTIQYQKGRLSGTNVMFQYTLVSPETSKEKDNDCKLELYIFLSAAFHYHALMGKTTSKYEKIENPDYFKKDMANYKYNSIEGFGGIGLGIPFLNRFKWINYIGIGGFATLNPNKETHYYNNYSYGLMLRSGITFDVK